MRVAPLVLAVVAVFAMFGVAQASPNSLGLTASYDARASLSYSTGKLAIDSTATVTNTTPSAVNQLTFNAAPLRIGAAVVKVVTVDGRHAVATVSDMSLTVDLPAPLPPAGRAVVRIAYDAQLPTSAGTDRNGYFRKANGIVAVGRWIPWLSRPVAFSRPTYGTPFVTASAPVVRVSITSRRGMRYATSGQLISVSEDGRTHRFVARNVRDFAWAAHPRYSVASIRVGPTTVTLYHRTFKATQVLDRARKALEFYTAQIGPYPWPTLTIAETPGPKSAEWPAAVWIATGRSTGYIVAHEIAHQWFYGAVGSDQAAEPWADEGISDLLARLHLRTFRASSCSTDTLDRSIYEYSDECYFETIYVQGGRYLDAYRDEVGDSAFWRGLRKYYTDYRFKLGGIRQLLDTLDSVSGRDSSLHGERFPTYYSVR